MQKTNTDSLPTLWLFFVSFLVVPLAHGQAPSMESSAKQLEKLFIADQSDPRPNGTPEEAQATEARGKQRRDQVATILAKRGVQAAEDYFRAAIIFQHSSLAADHLMAHVLATIAAYKGDKQSRWLSAAALDAYLRSTDKPQIFGTYYLAKGDRMLDPSFLSDALREEFCIPPVAEQEKNVELLKNGGNPISIKRIATPCEDKRPVDPKLLDAYVGRYQVMPNFILSVTKDDTRLFVQATCGPPLRLPACAQPKFEIFPKSEKDYFAKIGVEITFKTDKSEGQGPATELVLREKGVDRRAPRIDGEPQPPKDRKEIAVDPKLLDGYVGRYELVSNFILTITREGPHLFVQASGQPKVELFAESERDYFLKVVDAQITFDNEDQGRAAGLVLHQDGLDQHAKRIE